MYGNGAIAGLRSWGGRLAASGGLCLLLGGGLFCARIEAPRGGPEDRDPPRVIAAQPDSGAVSVPLDLPLSFTFSEGMNKSSVQDWLLVAPWPGKMDWSWEGTRVLVGPVAGWSPGETYTVLLMTQAADRRRNSMDHPVALVFSTGDTLPLGALAGEVHTRSLPSQGQLVALFRSSETDPAPGEEAFVPPPVRNALRLAQTDKEGAFRLTHVPGRGPYLLGALHDASGNRAFDAEEDLWVFWPELLWGPDTLSATGRTVYLVYDDEPGDLKGTVIDSACLGFKRPGLLRAEADSLRRVLTGEIDALGFAPSGDSLPDFRLTEVQEDSLQVRLGEVESQLADALRDSVRCSAPIWVSVFAEGDTTATDEVRTLGDFELREVVSGIYHLTAYRDLSGDAARGPDEPQGAFAHPVELLPGRVVSGIEIELRLP